MPKYAFTDLSALETGYIHREGHWSKCTVSVESHALHMAHHTLGQYTEWLQELTGLETIEASVEPDPPVEMLVAYLELTAKGVHEVFRVPTKDAIDRESLAEQLPPRLQPSHTLDYRFDLLSCIQSEAFIQRCTERFPAITKEMDALSQTRLAEERMHLQNRVLSLIREARRQWQLIVFTLDDVTILRMHAMMR